VGKFNQADVTIAWIRNTMELSLLGFSENLLPELKRNPNLEILGDPRDIEFEEDGNLVSVLLQAAELAPSH
jgi:hypothetical protein